MQAIYDFLVEAIALGIASTFLAWLVWRYLVTPSRAEVEFVVEAKRQGKDLLEYLESGGFSLSLLCSMDEEKREDFIKQLGYDLDHIDYFIYLAHEMPEYTQVDDRVYREWWLGYKDTRRMIRATNFLGAWRVG